jgi:hypothetical protein
MLFSRALFLKSGRKAKIIMEDPTNRDSTIVPCVHPGEEEKATNTNHRASLTGKTGHAFSREVAKRQ